MEIVKKFEMVWPSIDQRKQIKLFGMMDTDNKLGLYGSPGRRLGSANELQRLGSRGSYSQGEDSFFQANNNDENQNGNKKPPLTSTNKSQSTLLPKSLMNAQPGGNGKSAKLPPVQNQKTRNLKTAGASNSQVRIRTNQASNSINDQDSIPTQRIGGGFNQKSAFASNSMNSNNLGSPDKERVKFNVANQSLVESNSNKQEDQIQSQDVIIDETHDQNKIFCFGDTNAILQFSIGSMQLNQWFNQFQQKSIYFTKWWVQNFDNSSTYDGTLKYMSACATVDKKLYLSGGCFTTNAYPSSLCFEISTKSITRPVKKKNMLLKRYGHCTIFLNGFMYAIGGFSHKDLPNEIPVTLASCEKFSVLEKVWSYVSTMNESRSFASVVALENQLIYVFRRLHDFNVLQTIEKYDTINDSWVSLQFKLPVPLAKLGACVIDNRSVLICGGMSADFEPQKSTYQFDLQSIKWTKKANMIHPKLVSSGLFYSNGYAFAIDGNNEGDCERYNIEKDLWQRIPSFAGKINGENIFIYLFIIIYFKFYN